MFPSSSVTLSLQHMANMAVPAGNLDTTTALIYDSVHAFALALNELTGVQQVRQKPLECSGKTAWAHGNSLINYMKMVEFIGLSGPIKAGLSQSAEIFHLN